MRILKLHPTEEDYKKYVLMGDIQSPTKTMQMFIEIMKYINSLEYICFDEKNLINIKHTTYVFDSEHNKRILKSIIKKCPKVLNVNMNKMNYGNLSLVLDEEMNIVHLYDRSYKRVYGVYGFNTYIPCYQTLKGIYNNLINNTIDLKKQLRIMKTIYTSFNCFSPKKYKLENYNLTNGIIVQRLARVARFNSFNEIHISYERKLITSDRKETLPKRNNSYQIMNVHQIIPTPFDLHTKEELKEIINNKIEDDLVKIKKQAKAIIEQDIFN